MEILLRSCFSLKVFLGGNQLVFRQPEYCQGVAEEQEPSHTTVLQSFLGVRHVLQVSQGHVYLSSGGVSSV